MSATAWDDIPALTFAVVFGGRNLALITLSWLTKTLQSGCGGALSRRSNAFGVASLNQMLFY